MHGIDFNLDFEFVKTILIHKRKIYFFSILNHCCCNTQSNLIVFIVDFFFVNSSVKLEEDNLKNKTMSINN